MSAHPIPDGTPICPVCAQPAYATVYRPRYGDPILRWHCPVNDDVIGPTTPDLRRRRLALDDTRADDERMLALAAHYDGAL